MGNGMTPLRLRKAGPEEIEVLLGLWKERAAWIAEHHGAMWEPDQFTREGIDAKYDRPGYWVGFVGDEIAGGFLWMEKDLLYWPEKTDPGAVYLHKLVVGRRYEGQGLGRAFLDALADLARAAGKRVLRLDYDGDRPALGDLYRSAGFRTVETVTPPDGAFYYKAELVLGGPVPTPGAYFQTYLDVLPAGHPHRKARWIADSWGDGPVLADELGGLVAAGTKTATCTALGQFEASGEPLPEAGLLTVVLDGRGAPLCVVETFEVSVRRFDEVDAAFAFEEGEDDRSLESWRTEHRKYFTRTQAVLGQGFDPAMPLVCERFRKVFP